MTYKADLSSRQARKVIAREARTAAGAAVQRIAREIGAAILSRPVYPGAASTEHYAEPGAGIRIARALEQAAAQVTRDYIRHAREGGKGWQEIGAALGAGARASREGIGVDEAAFRISTGYNSGPPGPAVFRWSCRGCGLLITDQGPRGGRPDDAQPGHGENCPRLAAAYTAWDTRRADQDVE